MVGLRKLVPLADRVLVRRLVAQTKTAGGVYLPDAKIAKVKEGEVMAVGPGRTPEGGGSLVPLTLRVGDKVLLPEYSGQPVEVDGEELTLLREDDVLGRFQSQ